MRYVTIKKGLILLFLGCLVWVGYVQWLISSISTQNLPDRSDVGIVLGAALWSDWPSPALQERLDAAVELYEKGHFEKLIVTGGLGKHGYLTEAEGMKRYLVSKGIREENILKEEKASSTYENLQYSKEIMDKQGWERPIIITHEYHGARAVDIAKFVGIEEPSLYPVISRVLWMPWHKGRETIAFTKWKLDKLRK